MTTKRGQICTCGHNKTAHTCEKTPTACSYCGFRCKSFQSANAVQAQPVPDIPEERQQQKNER